MTLRVKGPRVLVQLRALPPEPDGLIVKPEDIATPPETMGRVLQLGDEPACPHCRKGRAFDVAVGDVIVFPASAGEIVLLGEDRYLILNATDISAVLDREAA